MDTHTTRENSSNYSHPSFSSTLLDAIYRSFDQEQDQIFIYGETIRKKKQSGAAMFQTEEDIANLRRACMIEKWMEKKVSEKMPARRKSTAAAEIFRSSSGGAGLFSSSDPEPFRPKPIRVCDSGLEKKEKSASSPEKTNKYQDGFLKTKSRALKIYADLKKVKKQPISPGARLAGFLNSLFTTSGNTKKPKMNNPEILKSANASTCSSASSFSRSCLRKTPSSRGKSAGGEKRSVRFSPVSVIVNEEDCQHKSLHEEMNIDCKKQNLEAINEEIILMENNRRVEEAARDFLRNYQNKIDREFPFDQEFDDDDDDDAASYASSDLFELDNLSAIGMERYREELPVYETTHLHTNQAIASGFIL